MAMPESSFYTQSSMLQLLLPQCTQCEGLSMGYSTLRLVPTELRWLIDTSAAAASTWTAIVLSAFYILSLQEGQRNHSTCCLS